MTAKIGSNDTIIDIVSKISEGDFEAAFVCYRLLQDTKGIDPDNVLSGLGLVLHFDSLGLYGADIWILYNDVCGQDLTKMCAVLRGWQFGYLEKSIIHYAVKNRGEGIDCDDVLAKVQARLPAFGQLKEIDAKTGLVAQESIS